MEFSCPCDPKRNSQFVIGFFCIPALLVFLIMLQIRGCKIRSKFKMFCECIKTTVFSAVPAMVWIILLFFDGHYFACAMTPWSGRFVKLEEAAPHKWCEPINRNSSQEFIIKTQQWFFQSQSIGLTIFGILTFVLGVYLMFGCKCCKKEEDAQEEDNVYSQVTRIKQDTTV